VLFSKIIGQQAIKTRFIRSVKEQRIPHAQLLRGPEGVGKLALAIAYAQYICCENKLDQDSCGSCPSCMKYQKLAHPDLHFVFPVIKPSNKSSVVCDDFIAEFRQMILSKQIFGVNEWYAQIAGDAKQGMIYANESEEIVRKLNLKSYESEYKIMIVWLPEKMNVTCANKLLKILEEPPEKTVFLLVSNEPDQIINTILSRAQHIVIPRIESDVLKLALLKNETIDADESVVTNAVSNANGSYLRAMQILDQSNENKQNFDRFVMLMRLAWQVGNKKDHPSLRTLRKWSEEMADSKIGREGQKNFLNYAQYMIRENFIYNLKNNQLNRLTLDEIDFSNRFSPFINERNVESMMNEFAMAEKHIEQNVNAKMVFFDLTLKTIMMLKK
jgi:DNA polymerase-3 subunit delta'